MQATLKPTYYTLHGLSSLYASGDFLERISYIYWNTQPLKAKKGRIFTQSRTAVQRYFFWWSEHKPPHLISKGAKTAGF